MMALSPACKVADLLPTNDDCDTSLAFCQPASDCLRPGWTLEAARHLRAPQAIDKLLDAAARHLRAARSDLANPASLPPSFRK
jgi:hypothetical protein